MIEYDPAEQGEDSSVEDFGVKVIGVGGSGANVLDRMALEGSDEAELLTLNTDMRALSTSVSSEKIQLGATLLKGMGTGGDPALGKQAALEAVDEIRDAVRGNKMVFVCVGLGGGTGSGAAPEVCRIAKEEGVFLVVFATLPFTFEGERRMTQAEDALASIGKYANAVMTFDNDRMGELIVPKDGVTQAFAAADKIISQSIRATINVVHRPGIIRIGMDDLLTSLDSEHSRCLFGYGQAKGDERSLEAVEQALKCPLLDKGKLLNNARCVLVQVAGGDSMTLHEVQMVMQEITKYIGSETQILFGTGTDKRLGNSLTVTVISSMKGPNKGGGSSAVDEAPKAILDPVETAPGGLMESALAAAVEQEKAKIPALEESADMVADEKPEESAKTDSTIYEPIDLDPVVTIKAKEGTPSSVPTMVVAKSDPKPAPASINVGNSEPQSSDLDGIPANPIAAAVQNDLAPPVDLGNTAAIEPLAPMGEVDSLPPFRAASEDDGSSTGDRVEAKTDSEETITLSRIVSDGETGKIQTRDKDELPPAGPVVATKAPAIVPTFENPSTVETRQQQEMLQLDPVAGKGRFSKTDPTIVDGEDLDVPTFLRRKKK